MTLSDFGLTVLAASLAGLIVTVLSAAYSRFRRPYYTSRSMENIRDMYPRIGYEESVCSSWHSVRSRENMEAKGARVVRYGQFRRREVRAFHDNGNELILMIDDASIASFRSHPDNYLNRN